MSTQNKQTVTDSGNAPSVEMKACRRALRLTAKMEPEKRIEEIDRILGNFGVEAIRGSWQNGYWCDVVADYSNTGDTYALTVIRVRANRGGPSSRFIISTVGDFVERNQTKLGIK